MRSGKLSLAAGLQVSRDRILKQHLLDLPGQRPAGGLRRAPICCLLLLALLCPGSSLAFTLKIAADPGRLQGLGTLAAEIRARTEGRVTLELISARSGPQAAVTWSRVVRGHLDGALLSGTTLEEILPELRRYRLPLAFTSLHELDLGRVELEGPYRQALRRAGVESFGWIEEEFVPQSNQTTWQCDFSTLVIGARRFAALPAGDRQLLLEILLRGSRGLDRRSRQLNQQAWQVPLLPAAPTVHSPISPALPQSGV